MTNKKKIIIIGAGPGGLAAGLLLSNNKDFDVTIYEKENQPGGRNSEIKEKGFRFDVGPTFFILKPIFDELFKRIKKNPDDYMKFIRLKPMYELFLSDDRKMKIYDDKQLMRNELKRVFPGEEKGLDKMHKAEKARYEALKPILAHNNNSWSYFLNPEFYTKIPKFSIQNSIIKEMGKYFKDDQAKLAFTFQAKYFGMTPWSCPAAFTFISFIEQYFGVYHVIGGLSEVSRQMAKIVKQQGGKIKYNTGVKKIITENKKAVGVELENGEKQFADEIICNADFAYAMTELFEPGQLKKYSKQKLDKKDYSASTFMMYLGLKKKYNLEHNNIVFAHEYIRSINTITGTEIPHPDISFYLRDTSKTDPTVAPEGKSTLYILLPVPNKQLAQINWKNQIPKMRKIILNAIKERIGIEDIEEQIEVEKYITPDDFIKDYNVYNGAVFNLSHKVMQMMWLRPHNKFEEFDNMYLVGGGTHPGSGLPTIYQSGIIAADLIEKKYNK